MATYRYIFNSLRTERVLEEIDLFGVFLSMGMNGDEGEFDGTFQLDQTGKRNEDLLAATEPGKTFVVVERNNIPIGGWIIGSRVYSAQSKTAQMHGSSFDKYPKRARVLTNLTFTNIEQREIFKSLWTNMQTVYGRNINVNIPSGTFSTVVPKTLICLATDIKYYGELMSSIADASDGFDWYIAFTREGNYYRKDLRIGYPILGTVDSPGSVVFEYPGNITQYYMTEAIGDAGTNILLLGAGEGSSMLTAEVAFTDLLDSGMIRLDVDVSRKDITNQSLLNTVAINEANNRRSPMLTLKVTVKGDKVPEFGSYNLGDTTRIVIKDPRNPFGFDKSIRLIKWVLNVPSSDKVEEAELIFEGDPD